MCNPLVQGTDSDSSEGGDAKRFDDDESPTADNQGEQSADAATDASAAPAADKPQRISFLAV